MRLLTVARLHWVKGHLYALHAAKLLKKELGTNFIWTFVGSGPERLALEGAVEDLGLHDVIRFVNGAPFHEIKKYFLNHDIFVLPSVREEFGLVLVEAAAAGLPIVATKIGGIPEAVLENRNAILVPPRDPNAMARAILTLAASTTMREEMGKAGKVHSLKFNAENIHARLMHIYQRVLCSHRSTNTDSP